MTIDAADVRTAIDYQTLADHLDVEITSRRGEWWTARCPTPGHDDRSPSCGISRDGWRCHGCGAGGSCIDLWMAVTGEDIPTAIDALVRWAGIAEGAPPQARRRMKPESVEAPADAPRMWHEHGPCWRRSGLA